MRLIACLSLLLASLPGCGLCEYRDFPSSFSVDVGLDDNGCPPPPSGAQDPPDNHGLVSIDGPGERRVKEKASASCCYQGRFLLQKAEFAGEICAKIELSGRGDEGGDPCPAAQQAASKARSWTFTHGDVTRGVNGSDLLELRGDPRLGGVSLRRDTCVYPATSRTTADACG